MWYFKKMLNVSSEDSFKDTNPERAAGTNNLSGSILKDGEVVLALSTSKLCNLLMKYFKFTLDCKIARRKS